MKIEVKTQVEHKVVACRGKSTGNIYLRTRDGSIVTISSEGLHGKHSCSFSDIATNTDDYEPLCEGDVVEITL